MDLTAQPKGKAIRDAGFATVSSRRYVRVTPGDVLQRIELRPNSRGGELTCDLTIHPLWARDNVSLDVLEPGIWIGTLCSRAGIDAPRWYERSEEGYSRLCVAIRDAGFGWFEDTATAEGIVESSESFPEPWRNSQFIHVELGHALLKAGRLQDAKQVFSRKPKRVPMFKTISGWIDSGATEEIASLHQGRIENARSQLQQDA